MNIKNMKNEKGFTIVELLIVIVVIGILAAITIVAYNGVQSRAKTTAAQDAASKIEQKAEAYNAEKSTYPPSIASLTTGASSTDSFYVTGITLSGTAISAPTQPNTVNLYSCSTGGLVIKFWDYSKGAVSGTAGAASSLLAGDTSGTCTTLITS